MESSVFRLSLASLCALLFIATMLPGSALGKPTDSKTEDQVDASREEEARATWLETRNLESTFKKLVYLSLQELATEGAIDSRILSEKVPTKRGRHQGFCFRKSKTGRFLPYICWKGEGENDEK